MLIIIHLFIRKYFYLHATAAHFYLCIVSSVDIYYYKYIQRELYVRQLHAVRCVQ